MGPVGWCKCDGTRVRRSGTAAQPSSTAAMSCRTSRPNVACTACPRIAARADSACRHTYAATEKTRAPPGGAGRCSDLFEEAPSVHDRSRRVPLARDAKRRGHSTPRGARDGRPSIARTLCVLGRQRLGQRRQSAPKASRCHERTPRVLITRHVRPQGTREHRSAYPRANAGLGAMAPASHHPSPPDRLRPFASQESHAQYSRPGGRDRAAAGKRGGGTTESAQAKQCAHLLFVVHAAWSLPCRLARGKTRGSCLNGACPRSGESASTNLMRASCAAATIAFVAPRSCPTIPMCSASSNCTTTTRCRPGRTGLDWFGFD